MLEDNSPQNGDNSAEDTVDHNIKARRNFFRASIGGGLAALVSSKQAQADHLEVANPEQFAVNDGNPSPPVIAWAETFPDYMFTPKPALNGLNPPSQKIANIAAGECGRNPVQKYEEFYSNSNNVDYYELHLKEALHTFNPAYPPQPIWGYDGIFPGPTLHARYGRPVVVRLFNELPQDHVGYGSPESALHLHNLHASSESDGFPGDYFSPKKVGPTLGDQNPNGGPQPGRYRDHHYHNIYAGIDELRQSDPNSIGDPREALGSLWYHDHTEDATAPNVVKGMLGAYFLYDETDPGDETQTNPNGIRFPSGEYDVPLMFTDMRFDQNGLQVFDQLDSDGTFGDMIVVNGKIKPFFNVARRRYRFRFYDTGPSREYIFEFQYNGTTIPFTYISNDGNLLPNPLLDQRRIILMPAERADIIMDFSSLPLGAEVYLMNYLDQDDTRKADGILDRNEGIQVMKIIVDREPPEPDLTTVLNANTLLRELPPIELDKVTNIRNFEFARSGGVWTINDKIFNVFQADVNFRKGDAEIWRLENGGGGWAHPIHIHMEEGRILSYNGQTPPPHMRGRKDVYPLQPGDEIEIYTKFRDFNGKYVMHCHNVIHEDHAMMLRFDVLGGEEPQTPTGNDAPPTISLDLPVTNDATNKTGFIEADAIGNGATITRVEFFNGSTLLSTATSEPYRANWQNAPNGTYQLSAKAIDSKGRQASSNIVTVVVSNQNQLPKLSLNPVANAGNKTGYVEATPVDIDGQITKVEFFYNGTLWVTATEAPYRANWQNAADGTYMLTAKAYDNQGGIINSSVVEVLVQTITDTGNQGPTISLVQPVVIEGNKAGYVEAIVLDHDGEINRVVFYHGNTILSTATRAPYRASWQNAPNATYLLSAIAYDNQGRMTKSNTVTVVVSG